MIDKDGSKSVYAIEQYINKDKQRLDRHKAYVLVYAARKDYGPRYLTVFAYVKNNLGNVIIENLDAIYNCSTNRFTTNDSKFSFIGRTLQIKTKDKIFGEISISITWL